jgi:hypothetical protein
MFRRAVLGAIQFEVEVRLQTEEIQDVWPKRMLPSEFIVGEVPVTEPAPK